MRVYTKLKKLDLAHNKITMKIELQQTLLDKYPEFFSTDRKIYIGEKSMNEEVQELLNQKEIVLPIQFGIETENGWFWLLDKLLNTIQHYCKDNNKPPINITQIKEKMGGLCFNYIGGDEIIDGMVWLAESLSYYICEYCGTNKNVGITQSWYSTICKDCHTKIENRKNLFWKEN